MTGALPDTRIQAVLFDADGVIQTTPSKFRDTLAPLLPPGDTDVDGFASEVFELERPSLTGEGDFAVSLAELLDRRRSTASVDDALRIWTLIDVEDGSLDTIAELRELGLLCCLTSNQQPHRARYMSDTLGYLRLFDAEFYSCDLGQAKPSKKYFRLVLEAIELEPDRVLFLDDHEENVAAALAVGIHAELFVIDRRSDNQASMCEVLSRYGIRVP